MISAHCNLHLAGSSDSLASVSQGLTPSPRLECSGIIFAHCILILLGSGNPSASATQRHYSKYHKFVLVMQPTTLNYQLHKQIRDRVFLCSPGWSQTLGLKQSSCLGLPNMKIDLAIEFLSCIGTVARPRYLGSSGFGEDIWHVSANNITGTQVAPKFYEIVKECAMEFSRGCRYDDIMILVADGICACELLCFKIVLFSEVAGKMAK
ncbi:hypothetical protein AAY473_037564 [Plecturocebus cupreus]